VGQEKEETKKNMNLNGLIAGASGVNAENNWHDDGRVSKNGIGDSGMNNGVTDHDSTVCTPPTVMNNNGSERHDAHVGSSSGESSEPCSPPLHCSITIRPTQPQCTNAHCEVAVPLPPLHPSTATPVLAPALPPAAVHGHVNDDENI